MMAKDSAKATGAWIEAMILSYGSQDIWPRVKARILRISKPLNLQTKLLETSGHLMFVSDDMVQIPGILTAEAWKKLQKTEERESLMSLSNSAVLLCRYSVMFHAEPEEDKSHFFINIEEMISLASDPIRCNIPKCTTLHTVRRKIHEAWRAQQGDRLAAVTDTQSGLYLTDLMTEWRKDKMRFLLNDAASCLQAPYCPSSPQPSTSWQTPIPMLLHLHLNTGWDVDRVQYKGVDPFVVPSSLLHIPEEQRQSLVTQPGAVEVREELSHVTSACGYSPQDDPAAGRDGHTANNEDLESSLLCEDLQDEQPANPWDMFGSAGIDTSLLLPTQVMTESVARDEVSLDDIPSAAVSCAGPPRAVSTQTPFGDSEELFTPSDSSSKWKDNVSVGPLWNLSRAAHSATGPPSLPLPLSLQQSEDHSLLPYQRPHLSSSSSSSGEPCISASQAVENKGPVRRSFCKANKGQQTLPEKDARTQGGSAEVPGARSLRPWLLGTPACYRTPRLGLRAQNQQPSRVAPRPNLVRVHADGTPFSYTYQSTALVAEALCSFNIPDELLQWSVRYLAHHKLKKITS
ncbi:uncharacterized protein LOC108933997 isoform X2 [Scleropages formosus]|uniref:uncharacterized protein LOC108933997 isoform X2 n=1 Tax=Scleropages formosus TaxID=113540 RepID=UPI000878818A|nr:uncharacterized protein LOC108933997 isoform X2 [Scleropages formosus]